MIKWDKQSGKQRYRCVLCGIYFTVKMNRSKERTS
ncbi:hypothetical protein [Butyricimonas faecihominis]